MFCRWQIKSGTLTNILQPQREQPDVKKKKEKKKHLNVMHCMKGVYVLSFNNVSRKIKISHNQIITGDCPSSGVWYCCQSKTGS